MKAFREACVLALAAIGPALLAVAVHPQLHDRVRAGLLPGEIRLTEVRDSYTEVLWIDARPHDEFARDHVPGAINLEPSAFDHRLGEVLASWRPDMVVVVYCSSASCDTSREVARRLEDAGLKNVHYLRGGWETWIAARG